MTRDLTLFVYNDIIIKLKSRASIRQYLLTLDIFYYYVVWQHFHLNQSKSPNEFFLPLEDRYYDVIVNRFGLGDDAERKTLEAIGKVYGITS